MALADSKQSSSPNEGPEAVFPIGQASSLKRLVAAFERGRLPASRWTLEMRLAVAVYYLWERPEWDATERFLNLICRYSRCEDAVVRERYHETTALFWLILASRFVEAHRDSGDLLEVVNAFVERFGERPELPESFYSEALLSSVRAHLTWVEPDRRPLDELAAEIAG